MSNFREQLKEDIELIQKEYGYIDDNLQRPEFAFNYWVLSRLYSIDEEMIPSLVTDIKDKGVDCYTHFEDTKELYLIQNKYDSETTAIDSYEVSYFLENPLTALTSGNYQRSEELQKIFDRICGDPDYKIWLHFYVTNDRRSNDIDNLFKSFSFSSDKVKAFVGAKIFYLSDIEEIYFGERFENKATFTATLRTKNAGTSLDVRPEAYGLSWMIDLRFCMVNVADLYELYKKATAKKYELFEENVREFLGKSSINNGIIRTLHDPKDRENFFYYNNGITLICEKCDTLRGTDASLGGAGQSNYGFKLTNPQIVNGCQTINSIAEVLSHYNEDTITKEFAKTFVLVKIYVFDEDTKIAKAGLDKNIVKYTNSQNGIDEKAFASKQKYFLNIRDEFEKRGVLLLVKPSDKNTFTNQYRDKGKFAELKKKGEPLFQLFDLDSGKFANYMIPLEKFLKVLLAFEKDGYYAFKKGSLVLKPTSDYYLEFSRTITERFTFDNMIRLYFLYNKAETEKKASVEKRYPIPYYVLGFMGKEFRGLDFLQKNEKLRLLFSNKQSLMLIYEFYKNITASYTEAYFDEKHEEYNTMIKSEIDEVLLEQRIKEGKRYASSDALRSFFIT